MENLIDNAANTATTIGNVIPLVFVIGVIVFLVGLAFYALIGGAKDSYDNYKGKTTPMIKSFILPVI